MKLSLKKTFTFFVCVAVLEVELRDWHLLSKRSTLNYFSSAFCF
jgi:hypothetical protein